MDPHPTPFAGKRQPVTAPATAAVKAAAAAPKPKSITAARTTRMAKKSPTVNANAGPQPRLRQREFGTVKSSNIPAQKPPPRLKNPSKVSPPPPQKPAKVSPPPLQKHSKLSPPATQKPSKLSPPNPVRATKPKTVAKSLKKAVPGADLEAKAKKRNQRVSFQVAAEESAAPRSREKGKAAADDAAGQTPVVATKTAEKSGKIVATGTPFFSAQNCSSCTLDQLESAAYWLQQIRLAETVGKHWVAAAFFRLAFECQAQPNHRIQSELRNYTVRHESASTLTPLFDDLLTAHGMRVNQPKFDTDAFEKVDTSLATNVVDKRLDPADTDECLKCVCDDDADDAGVVIVDKLESMECPTIEKKLDKSLEFDDCDAVIVNRIEEAIVDLVQSNVDTKVPYISVTVQSECGSSIEKLSPRGSIVHIDSSSGRLSLDNTFDKKSPLSCKRLTSSRPSYKKSASVRDQSSKRMPSGVHSDVEHLANSEVAEHHSKFTQDMGSDHRSLLDQFESKEPVEDAVNSEIH